MKRKDFFKAAVMLPMAGDWLITDQTFKPSQSMMLVDTHQHLLDTARFPSDWGQLPVEGNFGVSEYLHATRGLGVEKAVYMEVGVPMSRKREEAEYAIELCKDKNSPTVAAVISYDIRQRDFKSFLSQYKNSPYIKGIRASFRSSDDFSDNTIIQHARFLGELGMSLDFSISPRLLGAVSQLIKICPDTRFLVNHCANVDPKAFLPKGSVSGYADHNLQQWLNDVRAIASFRNTVCKISGVGSRSPGYEYNAKTLGPAVNSCLDIFGPDRVMFASDWPWCLRGIEVAEWVKILKQIVSTRSRIDQEKHFHRNAELFFNI